MIGTILSLIGIISIGYIFVKAIKIENKSKSRMKELRIVYSIGLKEYNKCNKLSYSKLH